jgi:hypothetical protein
MTGAFAASGLIFQPWLPNTWDKIARLSVFLLIIITAFIIWRNEHNKLKPVFSLQFVSNSLINRTPVPTLATLMAWAFRLEVKSECKRRITGLSGKLLCIQQPTGKTTEPAEFGDDVTEISVVAVSGVSQRGICLHGGGDSGAQLIQCDLRLGLEDNFVRNACGRAALGIVGPFPRQIQAVRDQQPLPLIIT